MKVNELKAEIIRKGLSIKQFSSLCEISNTNLWRKFKSPSLFRLDEITKMTEVLKLNNEKIIYIFFMKGEENGTTEH